MQTTIKGIDNLVTVATSQKKTSSSPDKSFFAQTLSKKQLPSQQGETTTSAIEPKTQSKTKDSSLLEKKDQEQMEQAVANSPNEITVTADQSASVVAASLISTTAAKVPKTMVKVSTSTAVGPVSTQIPAVDKKQSVFENIVSGSQLAQNVSTSNLSGKTNQAVTTETVSNSDDSQSILSAVSPGNSKMLSTTSLMQENSLKTTVKTSSSDPDNSVSTLAAARSSGETIEQTQITSGAAADSTIEPATGTTIAVSESKTSPTADSGTDTGSAIEQTLHQTTSLTSAPATDATSKQTTDAVTTVESEPVTNQTTASASTVTGEQETKPKVLSADTEKIAHSLSAATTVSQPAVTVDLDSTETKKTEAAISVQNDSVTSNPNINSLSVASSKIKVANQKNNKLLTNQVVDQKNQLSGMTSEVNDQPKAVFNKLQTVSALNQDLTIPTNQILPIAEDDQTADPQAVLVTTAGMQLTVSITAQNNNNDSANFTVTKQLTLDTSSNASQNQLVKDLATEIDSQSTSTLNTAASSQAQTVTVKLIPANLGNVQITMKVTQNQVSLEIKVQDPQVKQLFEKVADQLDQVIQNQPFLNPNVTVSKTQPVNLTSNSTSLNQLNFSFDSNGSAQQFSHQKQVVNYRASQIRYADVFKQKTADQQTDHADGTISILV
jgi:hypothetical protein